MSALDRRIREQMQGELLRIQRETGITTIFVTHDQAEALALSDRVLLMYGGHIAEDNIPTEVYLRPKSKFAAEFIGNSNLLSGTYQDGHAVGKNFRIPLYQEFPDGSKIVIMIKEENLAPSSRSYSMGQGLVTNILFQGTTTRITIQDHDIELNMRVLAREGAEIKMGQIIGWRAQYASAFLAAE